MDACDAGSQISKTPLGAAVPCWQEGVEKRFPYRISKCYLLRDERARDEIEIFDLTHLSLLVMMIFPGEIKHDS
jgi:hypothetical protein